MAELTSTCGAPAQQFSVVKTRLKTCYCVDSSQLPSIDSEVQKMRKMIAAQRAAGSLVAYLSTPLTSRGGGDFKVNEEIAHFVRLRLEEEFGRKLWVLDPSTIQALPDGATGADYMLMWTRVLAGKDGLGRDFDMFAMTGPTDVRAFFEQSQNRPSSITGTLEDWMNARAVIDADFRKRIAQKPQARNQFLAYYALKASGSFSAGSHDEWNAFVEINARRRQDWKKKGIAKQVPVYYDGRSLSPSEMETSISPGDASPCPPLNGKSP